MDETWETSSPVLGFCSFLRTYISLLSARPRSGKIFVVPMIFILSPYMYISFSLHVC